MADLDAVFPTLGHRAELATFAAKVNSTSKLGGSYAIWYDDGAVDHFFTPQAAAYMLNDIATHLAP